MQYNYRHFLKKFKVLIVKSWEIAIFALVNYISSHNARNE